MSLRRHLNKEGIAHAHADSRTHARHVRERKQNQGREWIVETTEENPSIEFRLRADDLKLGLGKYFVGNGAAEKVATGKEFEDHCNSINWARRWNYASMKRGEKITQVRRQRQTPACEELVVNLAPHQMRFINEELKLWKAAEIPAEERQILLEGIFNELRKVVVEDFQKSSGRDVLGSYLHYDSNKVHIGIINSRVGPENTLVGKKYLGTLGPFSVGQSRLQKLGMVDAADGRLSENLERFHSRFGNDRMPLDLHLHDVLDQKFQSLIEKMGPDAQKRFKASQEYYCEWKTKTRREALSKSPSSNRIAWQTLRFVAPLLPPQVRTALSIVRTASQAIAIIGAALDSSSPSPSPSRQQRQLYPSK